jgi:cob(I)alamin adenosyltransferase
MNKGLLIVYTGDGKGKTTAGIGSALRAYGRGMRVALLYFLKDANQGEIAAIQELDGFDTMVFGAGRFIDFDNIQPSDVEPIKEGLQKLTQILQTESYDMVVLDEILITVYYGLVPVSELLRILDTRKNTHIIVTGRYAPSEIVENADIVSEIGKIKHHFDQGASCIEGIEY